MSNQRPVSSSPRRPNRSRGSGAATDKTPRFFVGVAVAVGCVLLLIALAVGLRGCGTGLIPGRLGAAEVLRELVSNTLTIPGNHAPIFRFEPDPAAALPWKVHVDLSSTMQGFVCAPNTAFQELLERLSRLPKVSFVGYGEATDNPSQPSLPMHFQKCEYYDRVGGNYSNLFQRFIAETNYNHIFLTDGILVTNATPLPPDVYTEPTRALLSKGGDVALLAIPSHFDGILPSFVLFRRFPLGSSREEWSLSVRSSKRPFLAWIYTQPAQRVQDIVDRLNLAPGGTPAREGEKFNRNAPLVCDWVLPRFRPARHGSLAKHAVTSDGKKGEPVFASMESFAADEFLAITNGIQSGPDPLNVHFDVFLPLNTDSTNREEVIQSAQRNATNVWLQCWGVNDVNPIAGISNLLTSLDPLQQPRIPTISYVDSVATVEGDYVKARLVVRVNRPDVPSATAAWMLTLQEPPVWQWRQQWATLSTDDDTKPENGDRIYNLESVLSNIYRDCFVVDRIVFLTRWY